MYTFDVWLHDRVFKRPLPSLNPLVSDLFLMKNKDKTCPSDFSHFYYAIIELIGLALLSFFVQCSFP